MNSSPYRRTSAALAVLLLGAAGLFAQEPGKPDSAPVPLFGETVEVRVVNVEVVVTDKQGLPATGLAATDLVLKVDGAEVPIEFFTEVRGGDVIEGASEGPTLPGVPQLAPGTPVGTSYLVFIDEFFSLQRDRDRVIRELSDDLARLGPEDRMAVVAYDGRRLDMLSTWSQSTAELERVFRKALTRPSRGLERLADDRRIGHPSNNDRLLSGHARLQVPGGVRLNAGELDFAEVVESQVENMVAAVSSALRGFANPPGRKVLLMYSGGWPFDPLEYAINDYRRDVIDSRVKRGDELYAPLIGTANQLGYTIYPVDVPGLTEESTSTAEFAAISTFNDRNTLSQNQNNVQYSLQYVAKETGGKALLNSGRDVAFERAAEDTRTYYWLGFTPAWTGDDGKHKVEVSSRVADLRARNRTSFVDFSRQHETSMQVEGILLFGSGPGAAPLAVEVGAPTKSSRTRMKVPVTIQIPLEGLTTVATDKGVTAEVDLRIAALDDFGDRSEIPVIRLQIDMPREPPTGAFWPYTAMLQLRRAHNEVVVAVSDSSGGTIYSAKVDVRP